MSRAGTLDVDPLQCPAWCVLYRMIMPEHVCPYRIKARDLLRRRGYEVEDHLITTRAEQEGIKAELGVGTTPQVFVGNERIGGYDDLRRFFAERVRDPKAPTYWPIVAVFGVTAVIAWAASYGVTGQLVTGVGAMWFAGVATCLLAMLKLRDVERFSTMFLNYDLLARRWVRYGYLYPFLKLGVGAAMIAGVAAWIAGPVALVVGGVGAWSVFKAVYLDKRELKCACVGGDSNVPLGFVSLTDNLLMIAMSAWMLAT